MPSTHTVLSQRSRHPPSPKLSCTVHSQCLLRHLSLTLPSSPNLPLEFLPFIHQQATRSAHLNNSSTITSKPKSTTTTTTSPPMPCALSRLLPSMSPKTRILGLQLNREVVANHLKTCLSLLSLIAHQLPAIHHLDTNQPHFVSHLQSIQVRHLDIQTKLSGLINDLAGAEDWVVELGDGLASMQGKIRMCNHTSRSSSEMLQGDGGNGSGRAGRAEMERKWKLAATTYWPLIADSYAMAKPLLETVRDEMADGLDVLQGRSPTAKTIMAEYNKLPQPNLHHSSTSLQRPKLHLERSRRSNSIVSWFGGKRQPKSRPTTVRFATDVKARWFRRDEVIVNRQIQQKQVAFKRDHVVPLASDRKHSAADYRNRTT